MLPSTEALFLHWQRSCWVIHMWEQADRNTMTLEPITHHGWNITDEKLTVVWDTPQNIQAVRDSEAVVKRLQTCNWLHHWEMWLQENEPTLLRRMRV